MILITLQGIPEELHGAHYVEDLVLNQLGAAVETGTKHSLGMRSDAVLVTILPERVRGGLRGRLVATIYGQRITSRVWDNPPYALRDCIDSALDTFCKQFLPECTGVVTFFADTW